MKIKKVLIVDEVHHSLITKLEKNGIYCDYFPKTSLTETEKIIGEYDGLVIRSKFKLDKLLIDKAKNLKFIGRIGSGLENIDTDYASTKNIVCLNSPEGNRDSVGEHAVGMLLSLFAKICKADFEVKNGIWNRENNWGTELCGKTVAIIGYGNTGQAFAKRISGFEVNVIAYDKYKSSFSDNYAKEVDMNVIFEKADIVSLHLPLTSETHYLVNNKFISEFHKNIVIINTSRGQVVKTENLVEAIKSGKILGACLDVLEYENISFENLVLTEQNKSLNFLINSKKVILTPHIAGWTNESYRKLSEVLAQKIISLT